MASRIPAEKSADNPMGVSLFVTCCFPLCCLYYFFSLALLFAILITVYLDMVLFGVVLCRTFVLPGPGCFLSQVRKSSIYVPWDFPGDSVAKNPPANAWDIVQSLVQEVRSHSCEATVLCTTTTELVL